MTNPLLDYTSHLTADAKRDLANRVGTTPAGLHQIAHAYRSSGKLSLTPDLAARVEAATGGAVRREQCCVACGRCELAEKARGMRSNAGVTGAAQLANGPARMEG